MVLVLTPSRPGRPRSVARAFNLKLRRLSFFLGDFDGDSDGGSSKGDERAAHADSGRVRVRPGLLLRRIG